VTPGIAISVAALLITLVGGFAGIMRAVGRLETKFELVWAWYIDETRTQRAGGRRFNDPGGRWEAHDGSAPGGEG
jgi:hypothetical protein